MYDEFRVVDTALKNQIVSVFEYPYLLRLKKSYTGYATKTTLDIFTHIYTHYVHISATDISDNDERLCSPYNAEEPL